MRPQHSLFFSRQKHKHTHTRVNICMYRKSEKTNGYNMQHVRQTNRQADRKSYLHGSLGNSSVFEQNLLPVVGHMGSCVRIVAQFDQIDNFAFLVGNLQEAITLFQRGWTNRRRILATCIRWRRDRIGFRDGLRRMIGEISHGCIQNDWWWISVDGEAFGDRMWRMMTIETWLSREYFRQFFRRRSSTGGWRQCCRGTKGTFGIVRFIIGSDQFWCGCRRRRRRRCHDDCTYLKSRNERCFICAHFTRRSFIIH